MAEKCALIVDDEPDIRELLEITLGRMGIDTRSAANLGEARALLDSHDFQLCLTDMQLPDGDGISLVQQISDEQPHMPVAMITAFGSMDTAISALKAGAFDFVQKPVDLEQLRNLVETALKLDGLPGAGNAGDARHAPTGTRLTGNSAAMQRVRSQVAKLARSQAPIYISGESGSGKEVVARSIHEQGPRASAPFVPVNCGAIPGELMESEFFGHVKGSFTGAVSDKEGLFQSAHGGTLFLDEVADLPQQMQVKLLRAIQEKAVRPVGGHQEMAIDVRILSATHKDLAREVEAGRFRQDLFYRINVIELAVPPLRERTEDIPLFVDQLLARLATDYGTEKPRISPAALRALTEYSFPGNVRELQNVLERAFTLCEDHLIEVRDLQLSAAPPAPPPAVEIQAAGATSAAPVGEATSGTVTPAVESTDALPELEPGESLEDYLENIERTVITEALEATRWNKTAAAKRLGITFRALRYRLKKLDLE